MNRPSERRNTASFHLELNVLDRPLAPRLEGSSPKSGVQISEAPRS